MFTRPDNSVYRSRIITSDIDNAEVAARLGINRIRRSGRVIFYDDFGDGGLAWNIPVPFSATAGVFTTHTFLHPFTPPGMLVLNPGGVDAPYSSYALTFFPVAAVHSMGFEVTFKPSGDGETISQYVQFILDAGDYQFSVRLNRDNGSIEYLVKPSTWTFLCAYQDYVSWTNIKVVGDTDNGIYRFIEVNRDTFPVTDGAPTSLYRGVFRIYVEDNLSRLYGALVDNVIITTDESLR